MVAPPPDVVSVVAVVPELRVPLHAPSTTPLSTTPAKRTSPVVRSDACTLSPPVGPVLDWRLVSGR